MLLPATHAPHGRRAADSTTQTPWGHDLLGSPLPAHGLGVMGLAVFAEERAASQPQLPRMWAGMGGWPDARSEHPQRGLAGNATIILSGTGLAR